jgi:beta-lactam-binding protein with PASTA domain
VEDFTDMEVKNAEKLLKNQNLSARIIGTGEFVTAQIPAPGETVPGGSEVLLYLGEVPEETPVKVPDFLGMNRQQAADAAGELGLYILVSGNTSLKTTVKAVFHSPPESSTPSAHPAFFEHPQIVYKAENEANGQERPNASFAPRRA